MTLLSKYAVIKSNRDMVEKLLYRGADINY